MKKQVYEITVDGFLEEIYVAEVDESGKVLDEDKKYFIAVDPPHGLFKAKWTGSEWIEGATQEEIDELTKPIPSPPTQTDLLANELARTNQMVLELTELILGGM